MKNNTQNNNKKKGEKIPQSFMTKFIQIKKRFRQEKAQEKL